MPIAHSYTASAAGENLIGWQINRSWQDAADFFPISKFRDNYYRPDIITRILADLGEEAAVEHANISLKVLREKEEILKRQPPVVQIEWPRDSVATSEQSMVITYTVRSPSGLPVKAIYAMIDGVRVQDIKPSSGQDPKAEITSAVRLTLPERDATISIVAETESSSSEPRTINVLRLGASQPSPTQRNLYALLIGVGSYDDKSLELKFPSSDVEALAGKLEAQRGKAFRNVTINKLLDRQSGREATFENIRKQISWLRQQADAPEDVILLYFSGHGKSIGGAAYLLPVDFDGNLDVTGLDKFSMFSILQRINSTLVLMIDACHAAGGLDTIDFLNHAATRPDVRVVSYASSSRAQRSYGQGTNSFYTKALVEAFSGTADRTGKSLTTNDLQHYLAKRVEVLAAPYEQTPAMTASPFFRHMPIANFD